MPLAEIAAQPLCAGVLRLQFWDLTEALPDCSELFHITTAEAIVGFVAGCIDDVELIVVHCEAGISRSTGAAIALGAIFGCEVAHSNPEISPNALVMRLLRERAAAALGAASEAG